MLLVRKNILVLSFFFFLGGGGDHDLVKLKRTLFLFRVTFFIEERLI